MKLDDLCSESNWNSKKAILKTRFPLLRDADLRTPEEGNSGMFENLARMLGLTCDELGIVILSC